MSLFEPVDLRRWIDDHRHELKPPVGNKQVFRDERETIVMVVAGPNARKDYHVNVTEEFFFQIEGDIVLGIIDPDTGQPADIAIREGEVYLLPANVPHNPKRPRGTVGLVVEQKRPPGAVDKLQWYCDCCHQLLYEAEFTLANIETDLARIMQEFWSSEDLRRCPRTGEILAPPEEARPPAPRAG